MFWSLAWDAVSATRRSLSFTDHGMCEHYPPEIRDELFQLNNDLVLERRSVSYYSVRRRPSGFVEYPVKVNEIT